MSTFCARPGSAVQERLSSGGRRTCWRAYACIFPFPVFISSDRTKGFFGRVCAWFSCCDDITGCSAAFLHVVAKQQSPLQACLQLDIPCCYNVFSDLQEMNLRWCSGAAARCSLLQNIREECSGSGVGETFAKWDVKYPSLSHWEKMHYSTEWTRALTPSWLSMFTCIDEAYLNRPCWTGVVRQLMWFQRTKYDRKPYCKVVKNGAKSRFKWGIRWKECRPCTEWKLRGCLMCSIKRFHICCV